MSIGAGHLKNSALRRSVEVTVGNFQDNSSEKQLQQSSLFTLLLHIAFTSLWNSVFNKIFTISSLVLTLTKRVQEY